MAIVVTIDLIVPQGGYLNLRKLFLVSECHD